MMPATPDDVHISQVLINAPSDAVWTWISDPSKFSTIYPNWISKVTCVSANRYTAVTVKGDHFEVIPRCDRKHGVADFEIVDENNNVEISRARVYPLKADRCVVVYLTNRREGADDALWQDLKAGIDADLEHAREIIDRDITRVSNSISVADETTRIQEAPPTDASVSCRAVEGQESASRRYPYEPNEYNEALDELACGESRKEGKPHLPTFARLMLKRLDQIGLLHTPEGEAPENVRLVRLEQDQVVWLRFDTYRHPYYGYKEIEVVKPPRSDAAILASMVAWGAEPMDFDRVLRTIANDLVWKDRPAGNTDALAFLTSRPAKVQEYAEKLKNILEKKATAPVDWEPVLESFSGVQDYREGDHLAYMLHLIRYYRPQFDKHPLQEQLHMIKKGHGYIQDFLDALQTLQAFLEYGAPNRKLTPAVKDPERDVQAAILADVHVMTHREIGDLMNVPVPDTSAQCGGHVTVKKMVERGRRNLEEAFGEEGWLERIEVMKADKAWWRTLTRAERYLEEDRMHSFLV